MAAELTRRRFLGAAAAAGVATTAACTRGGLFRLARHEFPGKAHGPWKAGLAKIAITPTKSLWMAGFSARTKPSEGVIHELHAKALALEDELGRWAVLVTADLIGLPAVVASRIAEQVKNRYGIARDRLMLNCSHTHSGPVLASPLQITYRARMSPNQWRDIEDYTRELESRIVTLVGAAFQELRPARLRLGRGQASFAVNRRRKTDKGWVSSVVNPEGPVEHEVPVLRVETMAGQMRAVVFGYACHNTTLVSNSYRFCGDYAGFAQERLEKEHPGVTALFVEGCGADANPNPRGTVELARKHGEALATAVDQALGGSLSPVKGPLNCALEVFPIAFAPPPSRDSLEGQRTDKNEVIRRHAEEMLKMLDRDGRLPTEYPYTVQVWRFDGDLTVIALAGEVVGDYARRLKKELGPETLWVAGYSNDVFGYVPSLRVLQEGGYEGGEAMRGSRLPGPFAPTIEETIIGKTRELVERAWMK